MKLAISNIAWPLAAEADAAAVMLDHGFTGVEIAPTKKWPHPPAAKPREIAQYRREWNARGIDIVAAQSLLYGRPDLTLFDTADKRRETLAYLERICALAADLGARVLVFGSPKNRLLGPRPLADGLAIARDFFRQLGDIAQAAGVRIGLEANPTQYGADFLTRADEARRFVAELDHPAIRLHLCSGCMALAGDDGPTCIRQGAPLLAHFHISAPFLNHLADANIDHAALAAALHEVDFAGWASIEMKTLEPFSLANIASALAFAREHYQ